ncbi:MAG: hypothetical protein IPM54_23845 [Polyangiaceae bacterium]|nr:hypothetical protein [Polyangiaceae bacterium]
MGVGVGVTIFLLPSKTAPAWADELNPITQRPYTSVQEYEEVRRLSPAEIKQRRAQITNSKPNAPPAPAPVAQPQPQPAKRDAPPRRCLPCLPVPVGGTSYIYHSAAAGNKPHYGMANHTHHYKMHQSPPEKGCRCFWDPDFIHPTPEFSPLPGAVPWSTAVGGGIAP